MKLKVVIVDLQIPPKVKKWGLRIGIPAVVLTVAAVALAAPIHTWNNGDALNAADLNGNFAALAHSSGVSAHMSSAQSVPANGTVTMQFQVADFDVASEFSTATGIFTAKAPGYYLASCVAEPSVATGTGAINLEVMLNGTSAAEAERSWNSADLVTVDVQAFLFVPAGGEVSCQVTNHLGAATLNAGNQPWDQKDNRITVARVF